MEVDHYRADLAAALLRIEQLEARLALFEADPTHEKVMLAEARLARAREQRRWLQQTLPRLVIASFVLMGAYALTDPSLPGVVRMLAYALAAIGAVATGLSLLLVVTLARESTWSKRLDALERDVRIARGDVGLQLMIRERSVA